MVICPLCRIVLGPTQPTCPRDGQSGVELAIESIPDDLSQRFTVVEVFAKGGTGTLFLADEPQTSRRGILKVLHAPASANAGDRQRVKRELVKQATLANASLTMPLATGETGGATWLFREWVEGVSLKVRLHRAGALPLPEALAIAAQLATALDELHRAGLLHRDLKPGHVLLQQQPSNVAKATVIDAGVAASISAGTVFDVSGTAAYLSPEQATGKLVSFRSDLYSLGCVLYEMLVGQPPFTGDDAALLKAHASTPAPTPTVQMPTGVQTLLASLLAKEPRERPFSAQQVRRALEPFLPEATGAREPTQSFDQSGAAIALTADAMRGGAKPTGTLRPPEHKMTMMGMPAAVLGSAPPPPPPPPSSSRPGTLLGMPAVGAPPPPPPPPGARVSAPPAPPVGARSSAPPPPPGAKPTGRTVPPPPPAGAMRRDATQELGALDIVEVDQVMAKVASPAGTDELGAMDIEEAEQVLAGAPAAAAPTNGAGGELDYDDLAPTTAMSREEALAKETALAATALALPAPSPEEIAAAMAAMAAPEMAPAAPAYPQTAPMYAIPAGVPAPTPMYPASSPGMASAPGSVTSPGDYAYEQPKPKSNKGKIAIIVLGALLLMCVLSAGGVFALYTFVFSPSTETIAQVGPTLNGPIGPLGIDVPPVVNPPVVAPPIAAPVIHPPVVNPPIVAPVVNPPVATTVHVTINSSPPGAAIRLNGTAAGFAPIERDVPRDSMVNASASLDGFLDSSQSMSAGSDMTMTLTLQARPVVVATNDHPPDTHVADTHATDTHATDTHHVADTHATDTHATDTHATDTHHVADTHAADTHHADTHATDTHATDTHATDTHATDTHAGGTAASAVDALLAQARDHYTAHRYREAAAAYERAAALNPTRAGTFAGLGAARMAMGDAHGATVAYQRAVALQPTSSGFHAALGRAYLSGGDRARARSEFERALSIDPNNGAAHQGMQQL